ncbi:MAG: hypothetical protein U9O85_10370 [Euryarchaeota archaeon]|nr:hypothetical protein [Euryarchaeota archaeon]
MPIINALFVPIRGLSHTIVSAYGIQTGMESRQDFAVKATAASPADLPEFYRRVRGARRSIRNPK